MVGGLDLEVALHAVLEHRLAMIAVGGGHPKTAPVAYPYTSLAHQAARLLPPYPISQYPQRLVCLRRDP